MTAKAGRLFLWRLQMGRNTISSYLRIPAPMPEQKPHWERTLDIKGLLRCTPILSCLKSVRKTIRYPRRNAKKTVRFQENVSLLNTPSVLSKGFVSSRNAIAIAESVLPFAFLSLLVSVILTALLNFARGLIDK